MVNFPPPSLKYRAPSVTGPTTVMFESVVVVSGVTPLLSPLLDPSIPALAAPEIYQYSPLPCHPSAKSIPSSSELVDTRYLPFTVPPKNSIPSSPPL